MHVVLCFSIVNLPFLGTKHLTSLEPYNVLHITIAQQIIVFTFMKVHCSTGMFSSHLNALGNKNSMFAAKSK